MAVYLFYVFCITHPIVSARKKKPVSFRITKKKVIFPTDYFKQVVVIRNIILNIPTILVVVIAIRNIPSNTQREHFHQFF